jgi:hypothetical protein
LSSLELHPGPRHARGLTRHRVEQGARGEAGVPQLASCCTPTPDAQDPTLSTQSHTTSCGDCRLARSGGDGQTRGDAGPAGGPAPDPPHIRRACWVRQRELLAGQQRAHVSSRPRWAGRLRALSTASQPCARPPRCAAPIFGCPSPASMCSRSLCCNRYIFMNAFA